MTTTPGAARGILVAGARKHWTQQAMAPRRTTTPSMAVRIQLSHPPPHPQYIHLFCLLVSSVSAGLWLYMLPQGFFYEPQYVAGVVRASAMRFADAGHRGSRPLLEAGWCIETERWWVCLTAVVGQRQGQMWPVSVGGISDHTDLENFKLTETVLNQVCWNSRCHKVACRLVSLCNSCTSLLTQCISYWLFYPLTFSLTSSLSDRFFPAPFAFSLQNCSIWVDLPFHLPLYLCDSLTLTAGVPYPVLFMSGKISH